MEEFENREKLSSKRKNSIKDQVGSFFGLFFLIVVESCAYSHAGKHFVLLFQVSLHQTVLGRRELIFYLQILQLRLLNFCILCLSILCLLLSWLGAFLKLLHQWLLHFLIFYLNFLNLNFLLFLKQFNRLIFSSTMKLIKKLFF